MQYNKNWYSSLKKSPLTPPNWTFSFVWPILYFMIFLSFYLFFTSSKKFFSYGFYYFIIQLILNLSWTTIFFSYKKICFSFIITILLLFFIILTIREFYKINKLSAYLLIPYLIWVIFASYLNSYICFRNLDI